MNNIPPELAEKMSRLFIVAGAPLLLIFAARFIWLGWQRMKKGQQ